MTKDKDSNDSTELIKLDVEQLMADVRKNVDSKSQNQQSGIEVLNEGYSIGYEHFTKDKKDKRSD